MKGAPLTVPEARAIIIADEALQISYDARLEAGQTFGIEELSAWARLIKSALDRVAAFGEARVAQVGASTGYTIKRLTADDAAHIAELLRVSIDDKHWLAWHPKLREIREKMIEHLEDIHDQARIL